MTADVLEALRRALAREPALRLAILFGSRARGNERPDSDVDIGILTNRELSLADEAEVARRLEIEVGAPVDLVHIDRVGGALRWRIARDGVVLLSLPATEAARFLARTGIEHDDVREIELDAMRRYRARLAGGDS